MHQNLPAELMKKPYAIPDCIQQECNSTNCHYSIGMWEESIEKFFFADTSGSAILRLPICRKLGIVTLHCEIKMSIQLIKILKICYQVISSNSTSVVTSQINTILSSTLRKVPNSPQRRRGA